MSGESPILETEQAAQAMTSTSRAEKPEKPAKRDAFSELLSPKNKQPKQASHPPSKTNIKKRFGARDGLGAYIEKPESYPSNVVVYYNADFVVIHDMFPKSTLHLLLLPRDPAKTRLHPFEAFEDPEFLSKVKAETRKLRTLAAAELRRKYGKDSAQDKERQDALNADPPPDVLPHGRDWEKEVMCGIHAHPSMNHLHIHIISVDRYSDRLKHRKHYNSFSTPFFVDIEDFPLAKDDARRHPDREGYLRRDFKCWRCGKDFGNRFAELKSHLEAEFKGWKQL
ncbi:aprataxin-like protein [Aspergillus udagawae]|uniref:Aprataxin-like protein n=1 Tax=Aspergillus udagawae TaxID=91492 RepID=A0A8H3NZL8_9EURO|nr:aprataxin-like protein [Aspergillus udagawae]GFF22823.1 aprataxin-like protein [Aspergillus udagawae]GFF42511.1 aprataxin-like protein [Aspergillus udagawae]GFF79820.1 aprataxin-like protein [Aspergillus udagawae]GFG05893.1 aprataxin-like protein [Aspergillus udagawae]GIC85737.1 aprataxin-like protein [Aspergillus udagawae]